MALSASGCSAVAIYERDTADENLLAWCFPALDEGLRAALDAEFAGDLSDRDASHVSRFGSSWVYRCVWGTGVLAGRDSSSGHALGPSRLVWSPAGPRQPRCRPGPA